MKRHSRRLLQRHHVDSDNSSKMRRLGAVAGLASRPGLNAQDGYDWLREIRRFQARSAQPST